MTPDGAAALSDAGWRCAVLGSPISHSLSPTLHRAAYAELGLTGWTYDRFEVTESELADFVAGCGGNWRGLSLTMPLKAAALELGDVDPLARFAGELTIVARSPGKAEQLEALGLALQVEVHVLPWGAALPTTDLLISTVTTGAVDPIAAAIARCAPIVFDVVYEPWPTALARAAQQAGGSVINGLDLLVGQALGQIELMTGRTVSPDVLYAAGRAALAGRIRT